MLVSPFCHETFWYHKQPDKLCTNFPLQEIASLSYMFCAIYFCAFNLRKLQISVILFILYRLYNSKTINMAKTRNEFYMDLKQEGEWDGNKEERWKSRKRKVIRKLLSDDNVDIPVDVPFHLLSLYQPNDVIDNNALHRTLAAKTTYWTGWRRCGVWLAEASNAAHGMSNRRNNSICSYIQV